MILKFLRGLKIMTRIEWLENKHKELSELVEQLEQERESNRSFEHKSLLIKAKSDKLALKDEIELLRSNQM